jgi:hypothetical protein
MKPARAIPWEDHLTPKQQSILIGSLLGDARLECRSKSGTARLRIHQSDRQKDLVFWKYDHFRLWVKREPWKTTCVDSRNGKTYLSWFFHTQISSIFTPWLELFYPNKRKILPKSIVEYLNPLTLAVWFMDDGCFQKNAIILNTQSFSVSDHYLLHEIFIQHYGITAGIQKDRENVRLYFGKYSTEKILSIIRPYLLKTFYKTIPVTTDPERERLGVPDNQEISSNHMPVSEIRRKI